MVERSKQKSGSLLLLEAFVGQSRRKGEHLNFGYLNAFKVHSLQDRRGKCSFLHRKTVLTLT